MFIYDDIYINKLICVYVTIHVHVYVCAYIYIYIYINQLTGIPSTGSFKFP